MSILFTYRSSLMLLYGFCNINVLSLENARKCKVLFSYKPANRDELELNIDDVIEVLGEVEEGWWKGELRNEVSIKFITSLGYFYI